MAEQGSRSARAAGGSGRPPLRAALLAVFLFASCAPVLQPPYRQFSEADRLLESYVERRAFPGGVLAVGDGEGLIHLRPFGRLTYDEDAPAVTAATLYDLASLTKVVATTTMAMILVDEGRLDLDRPVRDFLPGFRHGGVTVRHLLSHSSGLPALAPFFKEVRGRDAYLERIQAMDLEYPAGSKSVYSDPGIILLGEVLEKAAGQPLDVFVEERVFKPLGMKDTMYRPPPGLRPRIAPTEEDPWRGRLIQGEVHDENTFAMGGIAPHAGLFGTAGDLSRFAGMMLNGGIVSRGTIELFTRKAGIPVSDRALGWDTKSAEGSSAGTLLSPSSFGHTGFTGTSMWIDPERKLYIILLTNRVHPTRENNLIREARPAVADAVVRALVRASDSASRPRDTPRDAPVVLLVALGDGAGDICRHSDLTAAGAELRQDAGVELDRPVGRDCRGCDVHGNRYRGEHFDPSRGRRGGVLTQVGDPYHEAR